MVVLCPYYKIPVSVRKDVSTFLLFSMSATAGGDNDLQFRGKIVYFIRPNSLETAKQNGN